MSLTSYRTAPPRACWGFAAAGRRPGIEKRFFPVSGRHPLGRPGGDLLSHVCSRSTIGAEGFHGRVRDGIGWGTLAMTTRSSQRTAPVLLGFTLRLSIADHACAASGLVLRTVAVFKPIEPLVPVSYTHYCASTPGLSTWSSSTALKGELVSRWASRLDAFSGYPFRT